MTGALEVLLSSTQTANVPAAGSCGIMNVMALGDAGITRVSYLSKGGIGKVCGKENIS